MAVPRRNISLPISIPIPAGYTAKVVNGSIVFVATSPPKPATAAPVPPPKPAARDPSLCHAYCRDGKLCHNKAKHGPYGQWCDLHRDEFSEDSDSDEEKEVKHVSRCKGVYKSGDHKGEQCKCKAKEGNYGFCGRHRKVDDKADKPKPSAEQKETTLCKGVYKSGARKGEPCIHNAKEGNYGFCGYHRKQ